MNQSIGQLVSLFVMMKYMLTDSRTFVFVFCLFSFSVTGLDIGKSSNSFVSMFSDLIILFILYYAVVAECRPPVICDGGICVLWTLSSNVFTFLLIVNFVSVLMDLDKKCCAWGQESKLVSENVNKSSTRAGRCFIYYKKITYSM